VKVCTRCEDEKPLEDFVKDKRRSDGRGSWCLICNRAYMNAFLARPEQVDRKAAYYIANRDTLLPANRQRWAENKERYSVANRAWAEANREWILNYFHDRSAERQALLNNLKSVPCVDCGTLYPPYCMEFDHMRGEKRAPVGKMLNHNIDRLLEEIAKCEIVCCACHRIRSAARLPPSKRPRKTAERRKWLQDLKATPCVDCGIVRPPVAMDFDHVRGEKSFELSNAVMYQDRSKILAEIAKCEIVCCLCHRVRTMKRREAA
jgi:hypothetical protein